jgi:uncharacterized protein
MREEVLVDSSGLRLRVEVAESHAERMRGLLRRERLPPGRALLIEGARSVHTFGMRFPIDVALLDRDLRVRWVRTVPQRRFVLPRPGVHHVLECAPGAAPRRGDRLTRLAGTTAR